MRDYELNLWSRYREGNESARKELILFYSPLVDLAAKRLAWVIGWASWKDLRQDGIIGLIKAISKFDGGRGVPFKAFARPYIHGAILDSSEVTRDLPHRQQPLVRKIWQAKRDLLKHLGRVPTIEEVAEKAELTTEQTEKAIDAEGIAFSEELLSDENPPLPSLIISPQPERTLSMLEALAHLSLREQHIIYLYYWEDQRSEGIAQELGLTISNVIKIRQRAIARLRDILTDTGCR